MGWATLFTNFIQIEISSQVKSNTIYRKSLQNSVFNPNLNNWTKAREIMW